MATVKVNFGSQALRMNNRGSILFYYPDNERGISLSSVMIAFQKQGYQVSLLTHAPEGLLHSDVSKHGVKVYSYTIPKNNTLIFYVKHTIYLSRFIKNKKIDIVYSHIQLANIIAVFAQLFCRAQFYICRHHSDCAFVDDNRKEKFVDKIINLLGKSFIVPSEKVLNQMTLVEHVSANKIHLIRYAYNFDEYPKPTKSNIEEIKKKYSAKLLLLKAARLIPEKRHLILFELVKKLVDLGYDIKLIVLSKGPLESKLVKFISENSMQNNIFMLGYKTDVLDYVAAIDLVIHVSESEASSNFVKEVGYLKKPIVVCKNVGDFDEYLVNKSNAFLINKEDPAPELESILRNCYEHKGELMELGNKLFEDVMARFSIENIISDYDQLNSNYDGK